MDGILWHRIVGFVDAMLVNILDSYRITAQRERLTTASGPFISPPQGLLLRSANCIEFRRMQKLIAGTVSLSSRLQVTVNQNLIAVHLVHRSTKLGVLVRSDDVAQRGKSLHNV